MSMADFFYDFSNVERQQHAYISVVKYRAISGLDIGKHFSDKVQHIRPSDNSRANLFTQPDLL